MCDERRERRREKNGGRAHEFGSIEDSLDYAGDERSTTDTSIFADELVHKKRVIRDPICVLASRRLLQGIRLLPEHALPHRGADEPEDLDEVGEPLQTTAAETEQLEEPDPDSVAHVAQLLLEVGKRGTP